MSIHKKNCDYNFGIFFLIRSGSRITTILKYLWRMPLKTNLAPQAVFCFVYQYIESQIIKIVVQISANRSLNICVGRKSINWHWDAAWIRHTLKLRFPLPTSAYIYNVVVILNIHSESARKFDSYLGWNEQFCGGVNFTDVIFSYVRLKMFKNLLIQFWECV